MAAGEGMSARRMEDLERRVLALEERTRAEIWHGGSQDAREEQMVLAHGECVGKSSAARILGVTRATVYAMIADGRIHAACAGRKVDVRSIARYMSRSASDGKPNRVS